MAIKRCWVATRACVGVGVENTSAPIESFVLSLVDDDLLVWPEFGAV